MINSLLTWANWRMIRGISTSGLLLAFGILFLLWLALKVIQRIKERKNQ